MNVKKILDFVKQLLIYFVAFIVIAAAVDWWRGRDLPKSDIPAFNEPTLSGEVVDLQSLSQDQVVIVYFWATWCGACRVTSPSISRLSRYYPVVSVAMSSGSDDVVRRYLDKNQYLFDVVNDDEQRISESWSIPVTPLVFFIKNGKVVDYTTGITLLPGLFWRAFKA